MILPFRSSAALRAPRDARLCLQGWAAGGSLCPLLTAGTQDPATGTVPTAERVIRTLSAELQREGDSSACSGTLPRLCSDRYINHERKHAES